MNRFRKESTTTAPVYIVYSRAHQFSLLANKSALQENKVKTVIRAAVVESALKRGKEKGRECSRGGSESQGKKRDGDVNRAKAVAVYII